MSDLPESSFRKIASKLNKDLNSFGRNQSVVFIGSTHDVDTLFQRAINQNFGSLGFCSSLYSNGNIVEKDIDFAQTVLKFCIAKDANNAVIYEYALATQYVKSGNHSDAISLLTGLKNKGWGMAYTTLAYMHLYGKGVPVSHSSYVALLKKGAKCRDVQSRSAYAHYLVRSRNVLKIIQGLALFLMNLPSALLKARTLEYTGRE